MATHAFSLIEHVQTGLLPYLNLRSKEPYNPVMVYACPRRSEGRKQVTMRLYSNTQIIQYRWSASKAILRNKAYQHSYS